MDNTLGCRFKYHRGSLKNTRCNDTKEPNNKYCEFHIKVRENNNIFKSDEYIYSYQEYKSRSKNNQFFEQFEIINNSISNIDNK